MYIYIPFRRLTFAPQLCPYRKEILIEFGTFKQGLFMNLGQLKIISTHKYVA